MLTLEELLNLIVGIENQAAVSEITYRNERIWPLLRLGIAHQLVYPHFKAMVNWENGIPAPLPQHFELRLSAIDRETAERFSSCDLLFFNHEWESGYKFGESYFNPWLDQTLWLAEKLGLRTVKIEPSPEVFTPRLIKTHFFVPSVSSERIHPEPRIFGFGKLKEVTEKKTGLIIEESFFIDQLTKIATWETYYFDLLTAIRPGAVMIECFYDPRKMVLSRVCRQLNIPFVDVQHGIIGEHHQMYTHWTDIPADGYPMLPSHFWNWGVNAASKMNSWFIGKPHLSTAGANAAAIFHLQNSPSFSAAVKDFFSKVTAAKKRISISLNGPIIIEPEFMYETIRSAPEDWIWLIRLHPCAENLANESSRVEKQLAAHGITNYEMEFSSKLPIWDILKQSDYHVTVTSTVAVEAAAIGVPSCFIDPQAMGMFPEIIASGAVKYISSADELLRDINFASAGERTTKVEPFLSANQIAAERAFSEILDLRNKRSLNHN